MRRTVKHEHGSGEPCLLVTIVLSFMLVAGALSVSGCGGGELSLRYEPRAELAIVTVESGGGMPFPGDDLMPLFQLFGDGSFLVYQRYPDTLMQGRLDDAAVADLLGKIADTGFFDLEDEYWDADVYDATYRSIAVTLSDAAKRVNVWMTVEVPVFDAAYDLIMDYPLGEVSEFVPDKGYLVVVSYPKTGGERYEYLDPESEIYKLLPDIETLNGASESHTAVEVDGATLMRLKEHESERGSRGFHIEQPESYLEVYAVYEPRMVGKP
jgi:hypothetical protein